ncbi:ATP-binding protein [Candidatus Margulisiibacteriota bacterium]
MHINFLLYTPILLLSLLLTIFVLFKDKHNKLNQSFFIIGTAISLWILCLLFADTTSSYETALYWCKLAIIGPAFIPAGFLYFSLLLIQRITTKQRTVLFLPTLIFIALSFTNLNVRDVIVHSWGAEVIAGPLYTFLFVYFILYFGIATYFLVKNYKTSDLLLKSQMKYVFFGYGFAISIGLITNLMLVLSGVSQFSVLGPFSSLIFLSAIAYAILRHRLMDIELIIKRSFVYSILVAVITGIFSINAYIIGLVLTGARRTLLAALIQAVILAFGFKPLEAYLSRITDRIFFKGKYNYRKTLREITYYMSSIMQLDELLDLITTTIIREMRVANISIFLKEDNNLILNTFKHCDQNQHIDVQHIAEKHSLVKFLKSRHKILNKDRLIAKLEKNKYSNYKRKEMLNIIEVLQKLHAILLVPFFVKGELIGFMSIGERLSGDLFSNEDIELLDTLASQLAISIENARLYSSSLQKVTELLALYEVGKIVASGQDLDGILDSILNTVINVVKVDRGIIFLYDREQEQLIARAARGREEDWQKLKLEDFSLPINKTAFGRILQTGKPIIKSKIRKTASPLGLHFLKILEVEAYVAVPLISKDQVIGVLAVDNKTSQTPIEKINVGLLTTLANQAAVTIENARLCRETEDQLEELKTLNLELGEMTNYNEDILANMSSGVIVIDNNGLLQTLNLQAEKIIKKTQAEVIGKTPQEIWPDETEFATNLGKVNKSGVTSKDITFNGTETEKILSITTTNLKDARKKIKGKLAVIIDKTELNKMELQIRRSDKLTALGRMAAGVAHEIKNPLTSMRLFIQMMAERYTIDPKFWDNNSDILLHELDRIDKIVGDFVGFAKTPTLNIHDVKLADIVNKVIRLIKVQAQEQKVRINVLVNEELVIKGDPQRLIQVFLNLILNAMQAMPEDMKDKQIIIKAKTTPNKMIEIEIIDNGCGIPEKDIEKLFTPFFTTKEKGTGLGLSIIHKLIEEHGGMIDIASKVGVGSTFYVTLPSPESQNIIPVEMGEINETEIKVI